MSLALAVAVINIAVCLYCFVIAVRKRRLVAVVWILLLYFSCLFIPVALEEKIEWHRGFDEEYFLASRSYIERCLWFVAAFNAVFAVTDAFLYRISSRVRGVVRWDLDVRYGKTLLVPTFFAYWLVGSVWYFVQSMNLGYRDYVEGASWGLVVLWAGAPLIVLLALQHRWRFAALVCAPYAYFAVHLSVRSFLLLSIVPLLIVGAYQKLSARGGPIFNWRLLVYFVSAGAVLIALSIFVSQWKTADVSLPDSGMPYGVVEVMRTSDFYGTRVGFSSIILYAWNYINPFALLLGIPKPLIDDTPAVIARILEGVPEGWPIYFHFPALLWSDAYLSFGWSGLWLAAFWAVVNSIWEWLMSLTHGMLILLLPAFAWHSYMLIRGAVAIASVPLSYGIYLSGAALLLGAAARWFLPRA